MHPMHTHDSDRDRWVGSRWAGLQSRSDRKVTPAPILGTFPRRRLLRFDLLHLWLTGEGGPGHKYCHQGLRAGVSLVVFLWLARLQPNQYFKDRRPRRLVTILMTCTSVKQQISLLFSCSCNL